MAKRKSQPAPVIPDPSPPAEADKPDLSYIAEALRPLAVPCSSVEIDPANVRKHPETNLTALRGSLRAYGQRKPIVVNKRTNTIEAGNGSLVVARELGWTHIAAVFVDDDPTTATGYAISDNRTAELAEWNDVDLLAQLAALGESADADLQKMLADLAAEHAVVLPSGDDLPDINETEKFTFVVTYAAADREILTKFLMIERLSKNRIGRDVLERIKTIVAARADQ
jgi:hypothetical protein